MAILEITITPQGGGEGNSDQLMPAMRTLLASGLKHEIHALGTTVEGDLEQLFELAQAMHQVTFDDQTRRVLTTIRIDQRCDREVTLESQRRAMIDRLSDELVAAG